MYTLALGQLNVEGQKVDIFLNTDELPPVLIGNRQQHIMTRCQSISGVFKAPTLLNNNLADVLQCLSAEVNYALLIMSSMYIAVFQDRHRRYGYFDPHSRQPDGLPSGFGSGTAVVFIFTHLSDLITKLVTLFRAVGSGPNASFELTPVQFQTVDELSGGENLPHVESNADVVPVAGQQELHMSSLPRAESEVTSPIKSNCITMPNLSKSNKQERIKLKRRVLKGEKKVAVDKNAKQRERYAKDKSYQQCKKSWIVDQYRQDPEFKQRRRSYYNRYCADNVEIKQRQRSYHKKCYQSDVEFKQRQRSYVKNGYQSDAEFKQRQRLYIKTVTKVMQSSNRDKCPTLTADTQMI
ncbi:uncharacterized protein LOC115579693 [Xyrichtys novacula]|uniref:Uncharacterized protein LOC115579693 n=1 Tax=Xyrichtys novacula TaxID=13765 RepID=A0AAV1GTN9_XYRNO|nr:uncharacterized protein LOC115579693 [Xyrichtys novacula]